MIKRMFLALLAMSMFGLAQGRDFWEVANKEAIDATQPPTMEYEPTGVPVSHTSPLTPCSAAGA